MKDTEDDFPTEEQITNVVSQSESDAYFSRLLYDWDFAESEIAIRRLGHLIDLCEMRNRPDAIEIALARGDDLLALDLEVSQQAV